MNISKSSKLGATLGFRCINVSDEFGRSAEVIIPARLTAQQVKESCNNVERFAIMHAGAFTEVAYQAYLSAQSWFKFKRPQAVTPDMADFMLRLQREFKRATTYQQRLSNKDFIEVFYGAVVGDLTDNLHRIRSAAYDVLKEHLGPADGLDAAFIAAIYACACYQGSVLSATVRSELALSGINWGRCLGGYGIDRVANLARRLIMRRWGFDVIAHQRKLETTAEYALLDMTRIVFDGKRTNERIREAFAEMTPEQRAVYGDISDQLVPETTAANYSLRKQTDG